MNKIEIQAGDVIEYNKTVTVRSGNLIAGDGTRTYRMTVTEVNGNQVKGVFVMTGKTGSMLISSCNWVKVLSSKVGA